MFIQLIDTDDAFDWTPTDDTGTLYDSVFSLRLVTDEVDRELRARHTRQAWDKKTHRAIDKLDEAAFVADVIDYAILGWTGVKAARTGDELACTTALKARLPERWKAEILRLCAGKEDGDVVAQAAQEKKPSALTSSSKPTPARMSSVA